jgi:hypothetical protein
MFFNLFDAELDGAQSVPSCIFKYILLNLLKAIKETPANNKRNAIDDIENIFL